MTNRSHTDAVDDGPMGESEHCYEVPSGVEPGVGVVEAVADATDESPMDLPPLNDTVDVDAMNALLGKATDEDGIALTLYYAGTVVVVDGDGTITVQ